MSKNDAFAKNKTKPRIEEVISEYVDANIREAAAEFAEYMRANKMSLRWASKDRYKALQKKTAICWVDLNTRPQPRKVEGFHRADQHSQIR